MYELALKLNAKRQRRGSIDFDLPEPVIEFDPEGNMESIVRSERGWAHRLIEEFMLSANECVATWIEQNGIPSVYRIHEMPDPKRIVDFEETASGFGYSLGFGEPAGEADDDEGRPARCAARRERRRARARGARRMRCRSDSGDAADVSEADGEDCGQAGGADSGYLMLRSLKQARYSEKNEGHFALASPCYTHFTSPIRRYPDLIVHRLLRELLRERRGCARRGDSEHGSAAVAGEATGAVTDARRSKREACGWEPIPEAELAAIAAESSQAERRADDAERELMEWKKMQFMEDRVGEDFGGIILSCTKYGFFVELDDLFIEGLVPIASLSGWGSDERFVFRDTDKQIVSTRGGQGFKMGQRVHVLLDRIDRQQRRLQFALVPDEARRRRQVAAEGEKAARGERAAEQLRRVAERAKRAKARSKGEGGKAAGKKESGDRRQARAVRQAALTRLQSKR